MLSWTDCQCNCWEPHRVNKCFLFDIFDFDGDLIAWNHVSAYCVSFADAMDSNGVYPGMQTNDNEDMDSPLFAPQQDC